VIAAAVYAGTLRHRRFTPVPHAFTYRTFMTFLDVDRIPELMAVSRFTGYNRWNWASFDDRDHFGPPATPLRERLAADARRQDVELPDGRIFLLTNLRYLGYCFNPISFFYCFDRASRLRLVMAEVNNTFGGSHNYWLRPAAGRRHFHAAAGKALDVSPFMPADVDYRFALTEPGDQIVAHIDTRRAGARLFDATLSLRRRPWTAAEVRRHLIRHPLMTATVTAGIHWEALRLWWKGVPIEV